MTTAPEPKVTSIIFINETGIHPLTQGTRNIYPGGEQGYWVNNYETAHFVWKVQNTGTTGNCWLRFGGGGWAQDWEGVMQAGEEKTFTTVQITATSRDGPAWGTSGFGVSCKDGTVVPYRNTDSKSLSIISINGFRIKAFVDTTRITASGNVSGSGLDENNNPWSVNSPYNTAPSADAVMHVGRYIATRNTLFTITCTNPTTGETLAAQEAPAMYEPFKVIEFHFGAYQPPIVVFTSLVMEDEAPDGTLTDYDIMAGQIPRTTLGGRRRYHFTVQNVGGSDAPGVTTNYTIGVGNGTLAPNATWSYTGLPLLNTETPPFDECCIVGYDPGNNFVETDRKCFTIGAAPQETYPTPSDIWCETGVVTPDGQTWCCNTVLDSAQAKTGTHSIRFDAPMGTSSFYLDLINGPAKCNLFPTMVFHVRVWDDAAKINHLLLVQLEDSAGRVAQQYVPVPAANVWDTKTLAVGTGALAWLRDLNFDWNSVKTIRFVVQSNNNMWIWIDELHFEVGLVKTSTLYVTVEDEVGNKLSDILCELGTYFGQVKYRSPYSGKTNAQGQATISNVPYQDSTGNPIPASYLVFATDTRYPVQYQQPLSEEKSVDLSGGDKSVSIVMGAALPDGDGGNGGKFTVNWWIVAGSAIAAASGIGLVYLVKRRKKKS